MSRGSPGAVGSFLARLPAPRRTARRSISKTASSSGASEVLQRALGLLLNRFVDQEIELPGPRIGLDLPIPFLPIFLKQPLSNSHCRRRTNSDGESVSIADL